jgi:hypothetical protein
VHKERKLRTGTELGEQNWELCTEYIEKRCDIDAEEENRTEIRVRSTALTELSTVHKERKLRTGTEMGEQN